MSVWPATRSDEAAHTEVMSSAPDRMRAPATTDPVTRTTPIHSRGSRHPGVVARVAGGTPVARAVVGTSGEGAWREEPREKVREVVRGTRPSLPHRPDFTPVSPQGPAGRRRAPDARWHDGPMADDPRFLTLADVAEVLNTSGAQVYALVRRGELPAIKIGGRGQWRVERVQLEEFIQRMYAETRTFVDQHPFVDARAPRSSDNISED